ncbi:MAG: Mbov_0397 family ICE element conjugal transfer ATPase [Metamycoplasmataceae bacterium]
MKNLIPKSLSQQKGIIYRNISIRDVILFLVIAALSFGIFAGIIVLDWMYRIIISCSLILFSLILFVNIKSYDAKFYVVIWYFLKYKFNPKKYSKVDTNDLNPYKSIEDGYLCTKKSEASPSQKMLVIKIRGIDITNLSQEKAKLKMDEFHSILINLDNNFIICKIREKFSFRKQIEWIKKQEEINKQKYNELLISEQEFKSREAQINSYKKNFEDPSRFLEDKFLSKNIYLIIFERTLENLELKAGDLISDLSEFGFETKKLNAFETVNFIKNIYNPFDEDFTDNQILENQENLDNIFNFDSLFFKKNNIEINEKYFLSFQNIADYPINIDDYWLSYLLLFSESSVVINFKKLSFENSTTLINKAIVNSESNEYNSKKQMEKRVFSNISDSFKVLADEISKGEQVIKTCNIIFLNHDVDEKYLQKTNRKIARDLKGKSIISNKLTYRQFEGLSSFLPKPFDPLISQYGREIPSKTIANGYPFLNSNLIDEKGLTLGSNWLGDPIVFDPFVLSDNRKNHNTMIIGSSGTGKSMLTKKMINWHLTNHRHMFILDVEREYKNICEYYGGKWIDVGGGASGKINPLEIFAIDQEEPKIQISFHLLFLESFFKIIFKELTSNQLRYLLFAIRKLYISWDFDKKDVTKLISTEFPIFKDLYLYIIKNKKQFIKSFGEVDVELVNSIIENELINDGPLSFYYNGPSTIKRNQSFITFDLNTLFEKNNTKLIQAQLFLCLNFIQREIREFGHDEREVVVVIDEAHLLIDKDNPIGLDFIFQLAKRIRKRNGSIILITQNPDDFLGSEEISKKTKAIINNTQYSFFFNLSPNNIKDIEDMYKAYGDGLSKDEKLYIAKAKRGEALFLVSGFDRHKIKINVSKKELEAINYKKNEKEIYE